MEALIAAGGTGSLKNFLLTLHVLGAIAAFGPVFVMPTIGAMASKEGAPVPWALKLQNTIALRHFALIGDIVMPSTGAALIVISNNPQLNPFEREGRWLAAAIILFIFAFIIGTFVMTPLGHRLQTMAEGGRFGPEFGGSIKRMQMFGMLNTLLLVAIIVLMVVKPGSGFIHL